MERVQVPLPKQATATHPSSCFTPPPELSPHIPAPPLHSSQSLLWNNSSNGHQDLIHTHQHWLPHCTHTDSAPHPDFWNALGAANNAGGTAVSHLLDSAIAPLDAGPPTLLLDDCVRVACTANNRSFPQSVISAPFSCKELDVAGAKSSNSLLVNFSSRTAEGMYRYPGAEDHGPVSAKMVDRSVGGHGFQGNVRSHQSKGLKSCAEEHGGESAETPLRKEMQKQREEGGGSSVYGTGDAGIGLKLGKRTYFGDSGGGGSAEASKQATLASNANACNSNAGNNACNSNGASSKKPKTAFPTVNVPRCQAEDCKIDLSGAKDYHRRHKVCEWHSKASKVKVASMDQRFCQQCSRFHVLSEFDEGKRSCRRRLAGHNERRRKQQPEPLSLLSAASYAYFAGAKHLFSTSLLDRPYFFAHEHAGADFENLKIRKLKEEPVGNHPALELRHFMQGSQRGDGHLLVGGSAQALVLAGGNVINPPTPLTTLATCLVPDHPQPSPETLVSGRALSLLSSSLGFPNTSNSVSTALGVSLPSSKGHILESHHATAAHQIMSSLSSCFTTSASKPTEILPLSHDHDMNTLPGPESAAATHSLSISQVQPSTILNFGGSYTFPLLPESDVQGDASRPVLDLMQVSFAGSFPPRRQVEHHFTDLEGLSMFGRQSLM